MSTPLVDVIRLGPATKIRLTTLKRRTGVENWNVLCRWAFCLSLNDGDPVGERHDEVGVSIEMTWKTFAGDSPDLYEALLVCRVAEEASELHTTTVITLLRRHITRGVSRLVGTPDLDSIVGLVSPQLGDMCLAKGPHN
jgi:DNA sulfur modification protein DndE